MVLAPVTRRASSIAADRRVWGTGMAMSGTSTVNRGQSGCPGWNGMYLNDLVAWRQSAAQALAAPEEARASPTQTKQDAHSYVFANARGNRKIAQSKMGF